MPDRPDSRHQRLHRGTDGAGYLIPRLEQLLGSTAAAVAIASTAFALYHLHYGVGYFLPILAEAVLFSLFFAATRRLWPLALVHMAQDVVPYL